MIDTSQAQAADDDMSSYERADQDTLTPEQIALALQLIEQDHLHQPPGGIPLDQALPFLGIFTKCCCCCKRRGSEDDDFQ